MKILGVFLLKLNACERRNCGFEKLCRYIFLPPIMFGGDGDKTAKNANGTGDAEPFDSAAGGPIGSVPEEEPFDSEQAAEDTLASAPPVTSNRSPTRTGRSHASSVVVSILQADKDLPTIQDHFSLPAPSSEVRFRRSNVRVYEQPDSQFVLQEHATVKSSHGIGGIGGLSGGSPSTGRIGPDAGRNLYITVKQTNDSNYGLTFLRATYSLVAVFMGGFLFIFGLELLLFLFIDLATELGVTHTQDRNVAAFIGVVLSIPVFVYALAISMAIVTRFVIDTWQGYPFLRTFGNWSSVTTDWASFVMILGIPLVTFICTLMMKLDDWWAISILTWFSTVIIFWGFFAACVIFYELGACVYLIGEADEQVKERNMGFWAKIKLAVVHTMRARMAGLKHELYLVDGNMELPDNGSYTESDLEPRMVKTGLYSKMTQWKCLSCIYEKLETPQRSWTIEEVRGNIPFVTKHSWSLEKLFCNHSVNAASVPVIKGPSAITRKQTKSSFACSILGNFLFLLLIVGLLVWLGLSWAPLAIIIVLVLLCCIPGAMSTIRLWQMYKEVGPQPEDEEDDDEDDDEASQSEGISAALYQVWESWKLTKPTVTFTWIIIALEFVLLYIWPLVHLCVLKNVPSAALFACLGIFAGVRHYLSPSVLLREIGNFAGLGMRENEKQKHKGLLGVQSKTEWEAKSRLSQIVGIGSDRARRFWNTIYGLLVIFFIVVTLAAVATTDDATIESDGAKDANEQVVLVEGFEYVAQPHLPYPTCKLKKGLALPSTESGLTDSDSNALSDTAFLAGLAYVKPGDAQYLLDQWLGQGIVTDNTDIVDEFKDNRPQFAQSPASYKLITITDVPQFAVVSIRGTSTYWDLMADAQLWLAAALFQGLRELLPLGSVWTPILHKTVRFVNVLQSESISKVSFYKETTAFVEFVKENSDIKTIIVTGHSLGGGLALITASQTNTTAIGLSAPNAMLSRETFDPPITEKALNTLTLNIVPVGDVIAMLDDKANLYQNIECRAAANDFIGCHGSTRSLCEITYTCGSGDRPAVCNCALDYGYPEPTPTGTGNQTNFTQACLEAAERANNLSSR